MSSTPLHHGVNGFSRGSNGIHRSTSYRAISMTRDGAAGSNLGAASNAEEEERDDDPIHRNLWARWESNQATIAALFSTHGTVPRGLSKPQDDIPAEPSAAEESAKPTNTRKRPARVLDEDYGDDDNEEDEDEEEVEKQSPLKRKATGPFPKTLLAHTAPAVQAPPSVTKPSVLRTINSTAADQVKSSEDVRKQLEEDKKLQAESAKRSFQSMFFTLENDRDAMLEQQKLDELDREVENEISGQQNGVNNASAVTSVPNASSDATQGTLGSADLGASSLTLKHLIARIDMHRGLVKASDSQLRTLISEVKKGRSKWASEDRVGQEELYEAAEKVLMELKAMTEYAQPFLNRVNKREAPDYFNVIKQPMDIGSMLKRLKSLSYKSKKEFTDELDLIWDNCLRYNAEPSHPLRKKAQHMRKETAKLVPLIPEITVRDRAEVEAEERRLQALAGEDSDDDDAPIMASRGRKAPKKGVAPSSRKAPATAATEDGSTPAPPDVKSAAQQSSTNFRLDLIRADSEVVDGEQNGFGTPPPGGLATPSVNGINGVNGIHGRIGSAVPSSQADIQEVDGLGHTVVTVPSEDLDEDDAEFKTWKQVTKKDRALAAAERSRLFRGYHLKEDEPALLRNKTMMRRWTRQQKAVETLPAEEGVQDESQNADPTAESETLAQGIETEQDSTLPDYYNPLSAIPDIPARWRWTTDSEGFATPKSDEYMRLYPRDKYTSASEGSLSKRMEANMKQMQDTRQICAKIGIVKQMQIQAQTYQNQFQKYEPRPFVEQDVGNVVVSEDGPLMAPWVNRAGFQRSVGKIFYHAGFEDFQPSALDAVTDLASEFMGRLVHTFKLYREQPGREDATSRYTFEERVLHTLDENGMDVEALETYVRDDVERLSTKLGVMHERMKSHLADLFRPALGDHAGADGVGAFNDGSEQFVGGDFAEDLGEDFFGFRELGLAEEFGLETLSVPLHLLQNRVHSAHQAHLNQSAGGGISSGLVFEPLPTYEAITNDSISGEIGLVQDFFRNRIRAKAPGEGGVLVEDEDLPQKQRFPKPRLPPTGKISSPRKRPIREQQQAAKKKRKLEEGKGVDVTKTVGPLKLVPTSSTTAGTTAKRKESSTDLSGDKDAEDDVDMAASREDGAGATNEKDSGMMSPESM